VGSFRTTVGIALVAVFVAGFAGHAREIRGPTGRLELEQRIFLSCFIQNHMLNVGNSIPFRNPHGHTNLVRSEARECGFLRPDNNSAQRHSSAPFC